MYLSCSCVRSAINGHSRRSSGVLTSVDLANIQDIVDGADAPENGVSDLSDPMLKDRIAELKAIRDQARVDAERAEDAIERLGPSITPHALKTFARQARKRMRTDGGGYRRDHLRALAQRVEVDTKQVRIMGSKAYFCARSSPPQA